jgi:hypothetical protein
VAVVAAVGFVLWSRMQGRPLKARRLIVLPVILAVLGITDLTGSSAPHLTPKDIAFLAAGVAISAILGAARGATIQIYPNQGELWQRYSKSTVGLWIALIAAKIVLLAIASSAGASAGGGTNGLLLSLGVSLLAEAAIVGPRAMSTGMPFATSHKDSDGYRTDRGRSHQGPIHRLLDGAVARPQPTDNPYRDVVRPSAPTPAQRQRDDRAQWAQAQQTPDSYRTDQYRSDRRRSHHGPIHRLLGATTDRQRPTRNETDRGTRPPAPTWNPPVQDDPADSNNQRYRDDAW